MKFRSQKGFTGIDLVVAITIILIAVGTITTIYVSINKTYREISRSSVAGKIATDIITAVDITNYFEIEKTETGPITITDENVNDLIEKLGSGAEGIKIPNGYTVTLEITEAQSDVINVKQLLKRIDLRISYLVSGEKKEVEFVKYKGRNGAIIPERPNTEFTDTDQYDYTAIKYNKLEYKWESTVFGDSTWYEYGEGLWPVVVKTPTGVAALVDGKINTSAGAVAYVWLPTIGRDPEQSRLSLYAEGIKIDNASGGLVDSYYLYKRHDIDETAQVIEEMQVECMYDEIDYTKEMNSGDLEYNEGWYYFENASSGINAIELETGAENAQVSLLFNYLASTDSASIVNTLQLTKDVYIYHNQTIKLKNMLNYPY